MKIEKSEIAGKLAKLKGTIPAKPSIECLKGVLVKNSTLTAYNLDLAVQCKVECDPSETYILPQRAIELIENLPDGEVEISPEKDAVIIKTETIVNRFASYPADDFPELPTVEDTTEIGINSDSLQKTINSIMYAAGVNCTKPQMNGILFDGDGEFLNLVACDGYRVAWAQLEHTEQMKMIVPRTTVQTILGIGISGSINIRHDSRRAIFQADGYTVMSRLLEGDFVNYKQAFPKYDNSVVIDRRAFMDSIKRASICAEEKGRPMTILSLWKDQLSITTKSVFGEYSEDMKMDSEIDKEIRIGFNARYLLDCIKSYSGPSLECSFGTSQTPMVADDGEIKAMVLPVRLKDEGG